MSKTHGPNKNINDHQRALLGSDLAFHHLEFNLILHKSFTQIKCMCHFDPAHVPRLRRWIVKPDGCCSEQEVTAETPDTSPVATPPLTFKLGRKTKPEWNKGSRTHLRGFAADGGALPCLGPGRLQPGSAGRTRPPMRRRSRSEGAKRPRPAAGPADDGAEGTKKCCER